jgi:hypothetical protein
LECENISTMLHFIPIRWLESIVFAATIAIFSSVASDAPASGIRNTSSMGVAVRQQESHRKSAEIEDDESTLEHAVSLGNISKIGNASREWTFTANGQLSSDVEQRTSFSEVNVLAQFKYIQPIWASQTNIFWKRRDARGGVMWDVPLGSDLSDVNLTEIVRGIGQALRRNLTDETKVVTDFGFQLIDVSDGRTNVFSAGVGTETAFSPVDAVRTRVGRNLVSGVVELNSDSANVVWLHAFDPETTANVGIGFASVTTDTVQFQSPSASVSLKHQQIAKTFNAAVKRDLERRPLSQDYRKVDEANVSATGVFTRSWGWSVSASKSWEREMVAVRENGNVEVLSDASKFSTALVWRHGRALLFDETKRTTAVELGIYWSDFSSSRSKVTIKGVQASINIFL